MEVTVMQIDRATVKQALEALEGAAECVQQNYLPDKCGHDWDEQITALRAALAASVPHGCHVDLDPGMKPDGCVLDGGRPETCIYAKRLLREGKDKTACEYWQPIEVTR